MTTEPMTTNEPLGAGLAEPVDRNGAFPRLTGEQRARLRAVGRTRAVESGEVLFRDGDAGYDFFVVESGAIAIVEGYGHENRVIAVHGPHRFLGEINLIAGSPAYLSAVVRDAGEVIQVPADRLRTLLAEDEELSNLILRAFMSRRSILIDIGAGVKVVGSRYQQDTRRVRTFLARNRVPYHWMDLEVDEEAEALLRGLGVTACETPVLIAGEQVLRNPSNAEIGSILGLGSRGAAPPMCDLIIVGAGPAGLAAAVYGASEGLDTQVIDKVAFGGQASTSARIENYLGFPTGISGSELAERAIIQASRFGAQYRKLDLPDLDRFEGLGVYYAATQAEAHLCAGDPVVIVGGGNSAGQAAMFLSQQASSCHLMIRGGDLGKSMSRYLIDELEQREQVELVTYSEVVELKGSDALEAIVVSDRRTNQRRELACRALFVFIGADPHTEWLRGHVAMDEHCFLLTGRDVQGEDLTAYSTEPFFLETSRPGIFAVGDVHAGSIKRVASAVGEGSMAVRLVHQRLAAAV
jgi:thioredoxin reductase (NADPH)